MLDVNNFYLLCLLAGGLAVYMHMNYIQTLIPPTAHYRGLPDAG